MEQNLIVFRPASEIHLKTHFVKQFFLKKLLFNLKHSLKENKIEFKLLNRFSGIIVCKTSNNKKAVPLMQKIFGIHSFSISESHSFSSLNDLKKIFLGFAEKNLSKGDSFALRISRNGKHGFSSHQAAVECGQQIMDVIKEIKVNLSNPSKEIFADIINNKVFLYSEKIKGAKGLPVGVEGKIGLLMQGKQEEIVAGYLMLKRGCNIFPVIKEMNSKIKNNLDLLFSWNSFNEFKPINLSELEKEKDFLSAIVLSETKESIALNKIMELQDKTGFVVFSPLTFYPENHFNEILSKVNK